MAITQTLPRGREQTLQGQVAIVTGASRGIGRAIALELAGHGAAVVVNYHSRADEAEAVAASVLESGGRAQVFQANVADEAEVRRLVDFTRRHLGPPTVLVSNAAVIQDQLTVAMTLDQWESVIQTSLRGTWLCIRAVARDMMAQRRGSIVCLSSIAADRGGRGHANYAAAKGGINAMTKSLAVELAPKGIRVNAVAPGVVVTEMSQRVREVAEDEILAQIPLKRFGDPEEVARAVRFLASDEASYITGEILHVTGGYGV
jgi:3-oxoacyl-[acyl-carrier protein] reductase